MNGTAKNNNESLVYLTDKEAELFVSLFRRYQHIWERAKKKCCPGSLVLHFDKDFNIRKKEFHEYEKDDLTE